MFSCSVLCGRSAEWPADLYTAGSAMRFPKILGIVRIYRVLGESGVVIDGLLVLERRQQCDPGGLGSQPFFSALLGFPSSWFPTAVSTFVIPVLDLLTHMPPLITSIHSAALIRYKRKQDRPGTSVRYRTSTGKGSTRPLTCGLN